MVDAGNHSIRRITPSGVVSTIAGTGQPGMIDGSLAVAQFHGPRGVAIDAAGIIYVSDVDNRRIRRIDVAADRVDTLAGNGIPGYADGVGSTAQFFGMEGIDVLPDGSAVYVADGNEGQGDPPYHRVRVVTLP
ncbi:MAG: hypothetical protein KC731_02390 [Myxococcales bacterium]|nr:hypothetical protein [Myxococcales bacterium]